MARPSYRGLLRSVIVAACLVFAAAALTGSLAPSAAAAARAPFRVLQMNLCDSGIAECYTGRSVARAATVIRADAPDVVTLNEVCRDDVYALDQALVHVDRGDTVVWAFKAAADRNTGGAYRCRNGQPYGIGLLARIPTSSRGYATYSGIYPTQDRSDPEERAWLCLYAVGDFNACTTHLANNNPTIAFAQCAYLLDTAIPAVRARTGGDEPTVLGGDFNLTYDRSPDVRSCLPSGYLREGDGGVQDVLATTDFTAISDRSIGMGGTTDHPGLLVALTARRASTGSGR
jgi:endonuclease/exonuclease/phosphatase family protein